MKFLRLLLIFWLSLANPTLALASVVNAGHCQHGNAASGEKMPHHGQHAQHAQHAKDADRQIQVEQAQHVAHADKIAKTDNSDCSCGCNCSGAHCATSCGGAMASGSFRNVYSFSPSFGLSVVQPAHALAAHSLDLLRPPGLT